MTIAPTVLIGAVGNTANQSTPYGLGSISPPSTALVTVIATATAGSPPLTPLIIGGGLAATWEEVCNLDVMGGRRLAMWAAVVPPEGLASGNITVGNSSAMGMTGIASEVIRWNGTHVGATALESFYVLGENSNSSATSLKAAPNLTLRGGRRRPTPSPRAPTPREPFVAGDVTLSLLAINQNVALTCERTELGDAGFTTPNHRLGVQWHAGDDADGPLFSWSTAAVCHAATLYMRDVTNPPPATAAPWVPSTVTVTV